MGGGNWKCNLKLADANSLVADVYNAISLDDSKTDVFCAPVALHIGTVKSTINSKIQVAAQNSSLTGMGAFTGEHSAQHLVDFGLSLVILGHSERRAKYGEDNICVANKTKAAVAAGLRVVLCIGEQLEDRENGNTNAILTAQLDECLKALESNDWKMVDVAYEPVWAIGTGKVATPQQAEETHKFVREYLASKLSAEVQDGIRIIYGGSVSDTNCGDLIKEQHIDGFLIGGASLKPAFKTIVDACNA